MSKENLRQLTDEQLEGRRDAALKRLDEARRAYNMRNTNISDDPRSRMPVTPISELQAQDDELQSAGASLCRF
jgi:hypothetical protein